MEAIGKRERERERWNLRFITVAIKAGATTVQYTSSTVFVRWKNMAKMVKLLLHLIKRHAMKTYGGVKVLLHYFLPQFEMELRVRRAGTWAA
jgi:beta-galactosidase GanA